MTFSRLCSIAALIAAIGLPTALPAQDAPPEIVELHRRIGIIRDELPAITDAAEYLADLFTRDSTLRFLVPAQYDPPTYLELARNEGGPAEVGNADDPSAHGVVILPVRTWDGTGFGIAAMVESYQNQGRPVIVLGAHTGKPGLSLGHWLLDNGAPAGGVELTDMNDIANLVVMWVLYAESVAAATRRGWKMGSNGPLAASGDPADKATPFHLRSDGTAVPAIPAGKLGGAYLTSVDSLLAVETSAEHQAAVRHVAEILRTERAGGARIYVSSCSYYLGQSIRRDSTASPFRPVDWHWDLAASLLAAGARHDDVALWFSYDTYNCGHGDVADAFADSLVKMVDVANTRPPESHPGRTLATLSLAWRLPDAIVRIPFDPQWVAPSSSIDQMVNYFWLKRLVGSP